MAINTNWSRWIFASVTKHFDSQSGIAHTEGATASDLPFLIEGEERDLRTTKEWAELRFDGPNFEEINKGVYIITLEVNILLNARIDDTDLHNLVRIIGKVLPALTTIELFKYGNDDSSFGCISVNSPIVTNQFGQIDPKVFIKSATVEVTYKGQI